MSLPSSATGGFLKPTTPFPPDGGSFDDLLQAVVVGVTGLPGDYVFPRWQPEPPEQPPQLTNWCAIGETSSDPQGFSYGEFHPDTVTGGSMEQVTYDTVEVIASFYGPDCMSFANLLRQGLQISQNRDTLISVGVAYIGPYGIRRVPELINNVWVDRADLTLMFNRIQSRTYNIQSILSASAQFVPNT